MSAFYGEIRVEAATEQEALEKLEGAFADFTDIELSRWIGDDDA